MARPRKCKRICKMPEITRFYCKNETTGNELVLTVEEYEVIRLIDIEDLSQEECALQMEVSRPTVQLLYNKARKKIACFIVNGGKLLIEGGSYKVCNNCKKCNKRKCQGRQRNSEHSAKEDEN